ncbi:MAG: hypothetical protein J6A16_06140 [Oscillospiraceae bacterium]|nr:hypothetical protein [Oscillospiraceae bacterium]
MSGLVDIFGASNGSSIEKSGTRSGIALAKITNIKDPKNLGRVKCAYITSDKDAGETGWLYCITPFGGNQYGSFFHPNVDDVVAIAYENGDIHRPFVIGCLWVKDAKPPLKVTNGKNEEYKFITPNKSYVDFVDTKGKEKITVATPKERTIILDDEKQLMQVSDGKNIISVDGKTGEVSLTCDKKLTIKVGAGVTITCDGTTGAVNIKTNKEVALDSAQINVKASGTAQVTGSMLTLKSSGVTTVKGSVTKIN